MAVQQRDYNEDHVITVAVPGSLTCTDSYLMTRRCDIVHL